MYINRATIVAYLLSIGIPVNPSELILIDSIGRIECSLSDKPDDSPVIIHKLDLLAAIKPDPRIYRFYEEVIAPDLVAERFEAIALPQAENPIWKVTIFGMSNPLAAKIREFLYTHKLADYSLIRNYPVLSDIDIYGINLRLLTGILVGFQIKADRFDLGADSNN
ncbi:hypothetical protein [Merismopedia glauca]|uniref:Uncharacterized protein n=1 Tax=Merismopedia glauca CCAP 1448/3 TaxID=1296344 RepID=A0A2T1BX29_9CYAN|nr:hypothetical protein [Merismopedia glauca]PSB00483.1 hypothetical protein C7B64_23260 [Merismopedia glauca CCAP 1448/3]